MQPESLQGEKYPSSQHSFPSYFESGLNEVYSWVPCLLHVYHKLLPWLLKHEEQRYILLCELY